MQVNHLLFSGWHLAARQLEQFSLLAAKDQTHHQVVYIFGSSTSTDYRGVGRVGEGSITAGRTYRVQQDVGGLEVPVDDRVLGLMEERQPFGGTQGDLQPC